MRVQFFSLLILLTIVSCTVRRTESVTQIDSTQVEDTAVIANPVGTDADDKNSMLGKINPEEYLEVLSYSEGLIAVKKESGWGFADENGAVVIACQFPSVSSFEEGKALVNSGGDSQDWRNNYEYIDKQGNKVGKFFVPLTGASECVEAHLTGSNVSGEQYASYLLSNCPDGKMSYTYQGWEWGDGATYYPNTTVESLMNTFASDQGEHAAIFKKFTGESTEFKEDEFNVTITVVKDEAGSLQGVTVSIVSDYSGANYTFSKETDGVLLSRSHGS